MAVPRTRRALTALAALAALVLVVGWTPAGRAPTSKDHATCPNFSEESCRGQILKIEFNFQDLTPGVFAGVGVRCWWLCWGTGTGGAFEGLALIWYNSEEGDYWYWGQIGIWRSPIVLKGVS